MERLAGQPPIQEQAARPERITDERLGNILAYAGNHEAKALTLLGMRMGIIYTSSFLDRMMLEFQGGKPGWKSARGNLFKYCMHSFAPIGLVVSEVIDKDTNTWGYIKTGKGQRTTALLGSLLNFSLEFQDISLEDVLGETSSPVESTLNQDEEFKKRSPLTRLRILFEIATRGQLPIRETDLLEAINEIHARGIAAHLEQLRDKGIILYDSKKAGEPVAFYKLSPLRPIENPNPFAQFTDRTLRVYNIILSKPDREWTSQDVANALVTEYPLRGGSKRENLTDNISGILAHLRASNYLDGRFSKKKQSEINLTDEQRAMIIQFLTIIDQYQDQDPEFIRRGAQLATEILSSPQKVATLMQKAKEHSGKANRRVQEDTFVDIKTIVAEHPGLSVREILDYLRIRQNRILHIATARSLASILLNTGNLRAETINGVRHYFSTPPRLP